ncbi:MAG TPA: biotin--[acetyl-CoA-carboxylase] ligase [Aquiluna sp.]
MRLDKSNQVFSSVSWFEEIDSTNLELGRQLAAGSGDFSAVIAGSQTNGQGRLGREWLSPSGASLSLSIAIKRPVENPGWLTLLAALAVQRMIKDLKISDVGIKWPNDVLVQGKKISGILAQLIDGVVIVGIGLNLKKQAPDLVATSLEELGLDLDIDTAASEIGALLKALIDDFELNPEGIKKEFSQACITLGQSVRAELPSGDQLFGIASEIDSLGQLVILTPEPTHLSAGDVWHLRS